MNKFAISLLQNVDFEPKGKDAIIKTITTIVGNFISIALFIAGGLAVIFIIIGAIRYITSAGNPSAVESAKKTIVYAVGGLILCILAYAVVNLIISTIK
ncbi:MAG: hypothetical protein Q8P54_01770 [bacterium]|nr:hypothetical protein [bacterium]